jgi:hypothetical protein
LEASVDLAKPATKVLVELRRSLEEQGGTPQQLMARMMESFGSIDDGQTGVVDENGLVSAFRHGSGIQLSRKEARRIAECFAEPESSETR